MAFATKNATVSALCKHSEKLVEMGLPHANFEHNLAVYSGQKGRIPGRYCFTQSETIDIFPRKNNGYGHEGASKITWDCHPTELWEMRLFVVKRLKVGCHIFYGEGTGNQEWDEIKCWEKLALTPDSDYLCPIVKYFTVKSDKVGPLSEKMINKIVVVAQKAEHIGNLYDACCAAEYENRKHGCKGTPAKVREKEMLDLANRMKWRDVQWNRGNSGVVYDYSKNCYKAVFVDYAL